MRRSTALVVAACAVGAVAVALGFHELRHDDAYITFRYARNLVTGDGYTFNPGQRILGTTSPLFTLVSASLYLVVGEALPAAAVAWNALALAAQGVLLFILLRRALPWTAALLGFLVVAGLASPFAWLSLETHTAAALVLGALVAADRNRPLAGGCLMGLAFLARPDAALLVPLLLFRYRRRTAPALRLLAAAGAVVLPWLVFASLYFGSPVPATMSAKRGITGFGEYLLYALAEASRLPMLPDGLPWSLATLLLAALGAVYALRRMPSMRPLLAYAAAILLAYAILGPPIAQYWHLYVPILVLRGLAVLAPAALVEKWVRHAPHGARLSAAARRSAFAALAAAMVTATAADGWRQARDLSQDFWLHVRHRRYVEVADWLALYAEPRRTFLAPEVGTLGYLTGHSMVDPYGLVTPTNELPRTRAWEDLFALIRHYRPELLLVDSIEEGALLERISPYRVVKAFPWDAPANVLLVLHEGVLREPGSLPELRRRAAPPAP